MKAVLDVFLCAQVVIINSTYDAIILAAAQIETLCNLIILKVCSLNMGLPTLNFTCFYLRQLKYPHTGVSCG